MRVLCQRGGFGLAHLLLEERPEPTPGPNEVLVRVRAASLNYRDWMMANGHYDPALKMPVVLGCDAAGEVVGLGAGASRFAVGARVCPIVARGWYDGPPTREVPRRMLGGPLDGTFAELVVVHEDDLVRAPAHLDDVEAATLPCAGVTAARGLFEEGGLPPPSGGTSSRKPTVLVIGTGGVSLFALLLARDAGAEVIVASRSGAKLEQARALGAAHGIDTSRAAGWGLAARQLTGGEGVDCVVEIGGPGTLAESLRAVRAGGTILLIGTRAEGQTPSLTPVLMRNVRLQGVLVGPRSTFEGLVARLERTGTKPHVDQVFPLADYRAAFEYLASSKAFGKLCLSLT